MKLQTTRALYDYWNGLRGENTVPFRAQVNPADFRDVLPHVFILERADEYTYPFRIAGTGICSNFGREFTSENFMELWSPEECEGLESLLLSITEDGAGAVLGIQCTTDQDRSVDMEVLLLPLMLDKEHSTQIIGAITPFKPQFWLGHEPIVSQSIKSLRLLWPDSTPDAVAQEQIARRSATVTPLPGRNIHAERRARLIVIEGGRSASS